MKKAAKQAALAAALAGALAAGEAELNSYEMRVVRVVDSDTYEAVVALWPGLARTHAVRLRGIDTPEKFRPAPECRAHERALAKRAGEMVESAFANAARVRLTGVGLGKYAGRVVGDVILLDSAGRETRLAELLMSAGLAVAYDGGTKVTDWCAVPSPP